MINNVKLSIITINYNNKTGLKRTIDSVISQTWRDFEWIIIDGGSTDGSKELIEQYQQDFSYWCSEPDKGIYNAMNKGIAQALGEYLIFMNSGDRFYDELILENIFKENLHGDVVYGECLQTDGKKELLVTYPHQVDFEFFLMWNICHQAMLIKSSILKKCGFDENYKLLGDWAQWLKIAYEGAEFQYINYIVCRFEVGGVSGTNKENVMCEYKRMIKKMPISKSLSEMIIDYKECKNKLYEYEECILTKDTLMLVKEGTVFVKLLHLYLVILKGLNYITKLLKS